jgi:hypothetical protein
MKKPSESKIKKKTEMSRNPVAVRAGLSIFGIICAKTSDQTRSNQVADKQRIVIPQPDQLPHAHAGQFLVSGNNPGTSPHLHILGCGTWQVGKATVPQRKAKTTRINTFTWRNFGRIEEQICG